MRGRRACLSFPGHAGPQVGAVPSLPDRSPRMVLTRRGRLVRTLLVEQVEDSEQADVTFSIASPPTVDSLCAPARTNGVWSCRIDADVVLNSDRWLHMTPTYEDLDEYRAYMVNHEVGHFLGYQHVDCGGDGQRAPVMLQQSMDLQGCSPNAWPATEGPA